MSPTCMPSCRAPARRSSRGIGCRRTGARLAMMKRCEPCLRNRAELVLVLLLAGILLVLFTPIPPELLDFLLITNFSFALLILLLTFYMARPLEFSTFPSLLLVATLVSARTQYRGDAPHPVGANAGESFRRSGARRRR